MGGKEIINPLEFEKNILLFITLEWFECTSLRILDVGLCLYSISMLLLLMYIYLYL